MITQERLIQKIVALPYSSLPAVEEFVDQMASNKQRLSPEEEERSIAEYAAEFGGTEFDLDRDLEEAGLEALANIDKDSK